MTELVIRIRHPPFRHCTAMHGMPSPTLTASPMTRFSAGTFLEALERSGAATAAQGWTPLHLVIEE